MKIWFISDLVCDQNNPHQLFTEWASVVNAKDGVVILGNVAAENVAFWFTQIKKLPGDKVLFCGDLEGNRTKWYYKFGFSGVVPFNESKILPCEYGPVLVSHLPAYESVVPGSKYGGLVRKLFKTFEHQSCVLNIHGHTKGLGLERHNTIDVSNNPLVGSNLRSMEQILEVAFRPATKL